MKFKSNFYYLHVGIYFLLSWPFVYSDCTKCEIKCKEPTKDYSTNPPYAVCSPSDHTRYPECADDVVAIVKEAINRSIHVKAFGNKLGQTDLICTEGIPLSIVGLQSFQINSDNTATFGAGVNLRYVTEFLRKHKRALKTIPVYGNITVAGAIATGEHGNSFKYDASLSSQVVKMTIVNSKGKLQVICDPEDLKAFSLSLGLLGIIVDVTFRTVELYKTLAHNYIASDDILTNDVAINWAKSTDEISFYWFPGSKEVVVANRTFVNVKTSGNAFTNDHLSSTYVNFARISAKAKEIAFGLTENTCAAANSLGYHILNVIEYFLESSLLVQTPDFVPIYTEDGFDVKNPAVGYYDLMSSSICYSDPKGPHGAACPDAHGINSITTLDNEFSICLADLPDFVKTVKDIISKTPTAFPLQGIRMTFSKKSDIYLSTAYGRQTLNLEFRMWNREDLFNRPSGSLGGYQTILQALVKKYKARSHWGKSGLVYHNSESLDMKLDPIARKKFVAAMNKFDPKGLFINSVGNRLKCRGTKVDANPLITHCALLDSCHCSKNSDCGALQICTTLPGYTYRVCKIKNEVAERNVNRSKLPPLKDVERHLEIDVPILAAGALAKCTI